MTDGTEQVRRLRAGDENAWRDFMKESGRLIFWVARKFRLNEADREELFQNTFLEAFRWMDRIQDPDKLGSWIFHIDG